MAAVKEVKEEVNSVPAQLKVASKTNPGAVAGALLASIREHGSTEILAVGAKAINQAVKGIAIAERLSQEDVFKLSSKFDFVDIEMPDGNITGMKIVVSI